jgi:hypothetical protein
MQVIEAQRASILEPHDHLHISQKSAFFSTTTRIASQSYSNSSNIRLLAADIPHL